MLVCIYIITLLLISIIILYSIIKPDQIDSIIVYNSYLSTVLLKRSPLLINHRSSITEHTRASTIFTSGVNMRMVDEYLKILISVKKKVWL